MTFRATFGEHDGDGVDWATLTLSLDEPRNPYWFQGRACEAVHDDLFEGGRGEGVSRALQRLGYERIGHNGVDASYWAPKVSDG